MAKGGTVGSLWINVKANTMGLSKGLGKARGMLGKFGKFAVSPAGLAVVAFAGVTAGVVAMTKALSASISEFMEFDKAMSEVKSVLLDLSGNQFDGLTKKAKELGATTANTATEIAGAMANLARAGFKEGDGFTQIQDAIKSVSDLANATGMDMAEASDIIAVGVKAFGLEASEATRVADVLALTASKTNTTVAELGEGMKFVAPVAKQLGFSIEETSAMLGKLADAGIKSTMGGTSLRKMMLSMGEDIEKHGTKAFTDFMSVQQGVTTNFDKFGARAVTGAGVLQQMSGQTAQLTEELYEATGAVDEMASRQLDNLAGDVTLFESAVSGLKMAIGEELNPVFREVVQVATKFINGLQGLFQHLFKDIGKTKNLTEIITSAFKTFGGIIVMVGTWAYKQFEQLSFVFNLLQTVAGAVLTAVVGAIQGIVEAVAWALNAVGMMSDDTYDSVVSFGRDLTTELAKMTKDNASEMVDNFSNGFLGGAEKAGLKAFDAFEKAMDNGLPVEEVESKGEEVGRAIADGMSTALENELPEATLKLLESVDKLEESLQKQIDTFGKSKGEVLALALAEKGLSSAKIQNVLAMEEQLDAMKKKKKADEQLVSDAQKVIDSLKTPEQIYNEEVANLQKMVDAKLLTLQQFEMAVAKLKSGTEDDIEVNIVTKGIVEGLETALGSVKVAGQVSKTEQLAEKSASIQENIQTLTESISASTSVTANLLENSMDKLSSEGLEELAKEANEINKNGFNSVVSELKNIANRGVPLT